MDEAGVAETELNSPVRNDTPGESTRAPEPGIALCLSGGGYRAMLFHLGSLWRLNEFGLLPKLARISSVSGGSITAGLLGLKWQRLSFNASGVATNLETEVVQPIRNLADHTIDLPSFVYGLLLPGSVAEWVAAAYRIHLFGNATLQDLPSDPPRFVINATSMQSGVLVRFMKPAIRDYKVGELLSPNLKLATAVAASKRIKARISSRHVGKIPTFDA